MGRRIQRKHTLLRTPKRCGAELGGGGSAESTSGGKAWDRVDQRRRRWEGGGSRKSKEESVERLPAKVWGFQISKMINSRIPACHLP